MNGKLKYQGMVMIATPFYNLQAYSTYVQSMVQTVQVLERLGVEFRFLPIHGDSYVNRARNTICKKFLDSECTDLFFIDSDEDWDTLAFLRILTSPFDVIGASYKMKNNWEAWTATLKVSDGQPMGQIVAPGHAVLEALILPCGFMRLKRKVLEDFASAYPGLRYADIGAEGQPTEYVNFFETATIDGVFHGEDATFCRRWRDIGGQLWVEPRAHITHYGIRGWTGNLHESLSANKAAA